MIPLITVDIPMTAVAIGVLGLLGPFCYSVFGTISPWLANRFTLEWTLAGAVGLVGLGQVMRAFFVSADTAFIWWSFVAIGGIGIANVLLPPIVRRFFPDRFGLMTGLYSMTIAITTFVPSIVTPVVAQYTGWREAIGMWFIFAVLALLPLLSLIAMSGSSRSSINRAARKSVARKVWTSPTSWAIAGAFTLSAFFAYTGMSWLPLVLADRIGATAIEAGAITAAAGATGLPTNLLVPLLATRMRNPALLYLVSGACGVTGALGMLLVPTTLPYLWAVLMGLASLIFSLNLYLLNLRTKSQEGTVVLSGMAQGIGYMVAAIGPLMFGILHQMTGGWDAPLLMLVIGGFAAIPIFMVLRKPVLVDAE